MTRFDYVRFPIAIASLALLLSACGGDDDAVGPDAGPDPGALVTISLDSTVGVYLEDLPTELRDDAADQALGQPDSFWIERAKRQIDHTWLRLAFRRLFALLEGQTKSQLPLPPRETWNVALDAEGAKRGTIDGHDVVALNYSMTTTILTDAESIKRAEPALATVGGHWDEHFVFPLDPEMVFQRTGYACLHEIPEVPQTFMDGENAYYFYDFDCIGHQFPEINCHLTTGDTEFDCDEALQMFVGRVDTSFKMDRVPWDEALADSVRGGESPEGVDLQARTEGVENNRLIYRYIPDGDCAIEEDCVGGAGWRRLLLFDASLINRGTDPLHMGDPDDLAKYNMFEYSACHDHQHFRFYGDFEVEADTTAQSDKKAFCLQSTRRYNNNEHSPLSTKYDKCQYQGIGAGWGDDYGAGLDCQWVNVTDFDYSGGPVSSTLSFTANQFGFLCEGKPVLGDDGNPIFEESEFVTAMGDPIYREKCDFLPDYDANNSASADVVLPDRGGYVTTPCTRGQLGYLRDCGYTEVTTPIDCTPGDPVNLTCSVADGSKPQLIRICEHSTVLNEGTACIWRFALAGGTVGSTPLDVSFTCPAQRDASEPGGKVTLYTSPALDSLDSQTVTCE